MRRARREIAGRTACFMCMDATRIGAGSAAHAGAGNRESAWPCPLTLVFNKIDLTGAAAHAIHGAVTEIFVAPRPGRASLCCAPI